MAGAQRGTRWVSLVHQWKPVRKCWMTRYFVSEDKPYTKTVDTDQIKTLAIWEVENCYASNAVPIVMEFEYRGRPRSMTVRLVHEGAR